MEIEKNQQPFFENKIMLTKELFKERNAALSGSMLAAKPWVLACMCLFFMLVGIGMLLLDLIFFGIFFIVFALILFLVTCVWSPLAINSAYKKVCELSDSIMTVTYYFYGDCVVGVDSNTTFRYEYVKIGAINESKNLCAFVLGNPKKGVKYGFAVSKNGFFYGDYENFKQFISTKTNLPVKKLR